MGIGQLHEKSGVLKKKKEEENETWKYGKGIFQEKRAVWVFRGVHGKWELGGNLKGEEEKIKSQREV